MRIGRMLSNRIRKKLRRINCTRGRRKRGFRRRQTNKTKKTR
jgi:hypothetical protein